VKIFGWVKYTLEVLSLFKLTLVPTPTFCPTGSTITIPVPGVHVVGEAFQLVEPF
jgi:hypothetical protein